MDLYWSIANNVIRILGLMANGTLISHFFQPYMKRRKHARWIGSVFFLTMLLLYVIPIEMQGITAFSIGLVSVLICAVVSDKRNRPQKIFLSATAYLLRWFSARISLLPWDFLCHATFLNSKLYGHENAQLMWYIVISVLTEILENSLLFGAFFFVNHVYRNKQKKMTKKEVLLLLTPYFPLLLGYWFSEYVSEIYSRDVPAEIWDTHPWFHPFLGAFQVVSFFAILVVIFAYQKICLAQDEATQNAVAASQIGELKRHIAGVEKLYEDMRSIRHEMNGHLMVLNNLYQRGEMASAEDYLSELHLELSEFSHTEKTGHPVTDILLTSKRAEAERKGIRFLSNVRFSATWNLDVIDISSIFSNALNNAIEASDHCSDPFVSVTADRKKNVYMIEVRNHFDGVLYFGADGLPVTEKDDRMLHGYGLTNMRRVAEKYFGTIDLRRDGEYVVFLAMLQITAENEPFTE